MKNRGFAAGILLAVLLMILVPAAVWAENGKQVTMEYIWVMEGKSGVSFSVDTSGFGSKVSKIIVQISRSMEDFRHNVVWQSDAYDSQYYQTDLLTDFCSIPFDLRYSTTYYIRAYATDGLTGVYSDVQSFTTYDRTEGMINEPDETETVFTVPDLTVKAAPTPVPPKPEPDPVPPSTAREVTPTAPNPPPTPTQPAEEEPDGTTTQSLMKLRDGLFALFGRGNLGNQTTDYGFEVADNVDFAGAERKPPQDVSLSEKEQIQVDMTLRADEAGWFVVYLELPPVAEGATYYVRAYTSGSAGESFGQPLTLVMPATAVSSEEVSSEPASSEVESSAPESSMPESSQPENSRLSSRAKMTLWGVVWIGGIGLVFAGKFGYDWWKKRGSSKKDKL